MTNKISLPGLETKISANHMWLETLYGVFGDFEKIRAAQRIMSTLCFKPTKYHLLAVQLVSITGVTPRQFVEVMEKALELPDPPEPDLTRDQAVDAIEAAIICAQRVLDLLRYTRTDMSRHLGSGPGKFDREIHTHHFADVPGNKETEDDSSQSQQRPSSAGLSCLRPILERDLPLPGNPAPLSTPHGASDLRSKPSIQGKPV